MADEILEQQQTEDFYKDENLETIEQLKLQQQRELAARDAKYATLLKAYTNGERAETSDSITLTPEQLKEQHDANCVSCINDHMSSLDMATKMLQVRQYELDLHGKDIFLGDNINPSEVDISKAQQVADYIQYAIENSNGDNEVFSTIIGSHLNEVLR